MCAAGDFHVKQLDVTSEASVKKCVADTIKEHGRLDVLINNAGFGTRKNVEQVRDISLSCKTPRQSRSLAIWMRSPTMQAMGLCKTLNRCTDLCHGMPACIRMSVQPSPGDLVSTEAWLVCGSGSQCLAIHVTCAWRNTWWAQ